MSSPGSQPAEKNDPQSFPVLDHQFLSFWKEAAGEDLGAFLEELKSLFKVEYQERREELIAALESPEDEVLSALVHRICGSIGNVALGRAAAYCRSVELGLRAGTFTEYDSLVSRMDAYVSEGLEELETIS
ncbi:MAG: Hpt domain-containing protein [Verrucomicrobiota bacterium]